MKNIRNPLDGIVHQEDRPAEETEKWVRQLPNLRIIDDDTWNVAQTLLDQNKKRMENRQKPNGTWRGSQTGNAADHPRHLLAQLIECECGTFLTIGGAHGKYLACPRYPVGKCKCKTQLCRELAEKLILDAIRNRIFADAAWKEAILQETRQSWHKQAHQQPEEIRRLENALVDGERKIQRLVDSIENGNNSPEVQQRLQERRRENESLRKELCKAQAIPEAPAEEPTMEWIERQLSELSVVLRGTEPSAAWALRNLVGGKILVHEIREPGRKRFFLQGKISFSVRQTIQALERKCGPGSIGPTTRRGRNSPFHGDHH